MGLFNPGSLPVFVFCNAMQCKPLEATSFEYIYIPATRESVSRLAECCAYITTNLNVFIWKQ